MKPEPLKDKYEEYSTGLWLDKQRDDIRLSPDASDIFNNIKSAIVWYKEKLKEYHPSWTKAYKTEMRLLKKAFEDVIKK